MFNKGKQEQQNHIKQYNCQAPQLLSTSNNKHPTLLNTPTIKIPLLSQFQSLSEAPLPQGAATLPSPGGSGSPSGLLVEIESLAIVPGVPLLHYQRLAQICAACYHSFKGHATCHHSGSPLLLGECCLKVSLPAMHETLPPLVE